MATLLTNRLGIGRSHPSDPIGTRLKLDGVDWRGHPSLLLALSVGCHFCTESADFYRKLAAECRKDGLHLSAALPQPENESKSYLLNLGVHVDDVKQVSLSSLGVDGTPTLLLVDSSGIVKKAWVGKLQAEREQQVLGAVRSATGR